MRSKNILIGMAALVALLAGACAEPPTQQVDAARAALSDAEAAEAETYAPEALESARSAMDAVQTELDAQQAKFALFRSYKQTETLITDAIAKAGAAKDAAVAGKKQAMADSQAAIDAAKATLDNAGTLIADLEGCRRRPKGFAADLAALKGNLDGLMSELSSAESSHSREAYIQARSQAETVNGRGQTLVADLEAAKQKLRC
jgi:hypothetical protein